MKRAAVAWLLLILSFPLAGCAVLNTFQTPEVQKPGDVALGLGYTGGTSGDVIEHYNEDRRQVPFSHAEIYGRIGLFPRTELGIRAAGLGAFGADLKIQILQRPLLVATNVGVGRGGGGFCLPDCVSETTRTYYGSLIAGSKQLPLVDQVYGAVKLTDYFYKVERSAGPKPTTGRTFHRLIPGFSVGAVGRSEGSVRPILEANAYFMPHFTYTVSGGIQIALN